MSKTEKIDNDEIQNDDIEEDIDEDIDEVSDKSNDTDFEVMFKKSANKHKLEGTHSLKRDTIFMGKEEELEEEDIGDSNSDFDSDNYNIERGSLQEMESRNYEEYFYKKSLTQDVYKILNNKTSIKFTDNRRKPNKKTFNEYYKMCINELGIKYTKSEIFVELSYYFTDNIFNMFKLLNKKHATGIIKELKDKGYLDDIGNINFI